jgi:hypothetical protein
MVAKNTLALAARINGCDKVWSSQLDYQPIVSGLPDIPAAIGFLSKLICSPLICRLN